MDVHVAVLAVAGDEDQGERCHEREYEEGFHLSQRGLGNRQIQSTSIQPDPSLGFRRECPSPSRSNGRVQRLIGDLDQTHS